MSITPHFKLSQLKILRKSQLLWKANIVLPPPKLNKLGDPGPCDSSLIILGISILCLHRLQTQEQLPMISSYFFIFKNVYFISGNVGGQMSTCNDYIVHSGVFRSQVPAVHFKLGFQTL